MWFWCLILQRLYAMLWFVCCNIDFWCSICQFPFAFLSLWLLLSNKSGWTQIYMVDTPYWHVISILSQHNKAQTVIIPIFLADLFQQIQFCSNVADAVAVNLCMLLYIYVIVTLTELQYMFFILSLLLDCEVSKSLCFIQNVFWSFDSLHSVWHNPHYIHKSLSGNQC